MLLGLAACPAPKSPAEDPSVVALVNGEPIPREALEQELSRELFPGETFQLPAEAAKQRETLLATLIDRALLLQAAKAASISVTPEEVDRGVLRISSDYPGEGFNEALEQGQTNLPELKQKTTQLLTIEKLLQSQVYSRIAVTEDELRRYFDDHPAEFERPEEVHGAQIVVKGYDEAKRVQQLLRQGKKFSDLARKYSLSADAKLGGDLGFFAAGVMPPAFDEQFFKLPVDQVSDVVASDYGYHLFKVLEKRPARRQDLATVRGPLEAKLLEAKRLSAQKGFLAEQRKKASIRVFEKTLATVTPKGRASGTRIPEP